ncbi:MAG TPA: hypothetical protein VEK57_20725 [Thermoanaerobaculia bacterium]|nr:hypothetical protein [Thermoanaerobaculia bacterium]
MRLRKLRILVIALVLLLTASNLPAPLQPDCNNQPHLECGYTCTRYGGCIIVVTGDGRYDNDFCYRIGTGTGCMGGSFHKCCV